MLLKLSVASAVEHLHSTTYAIHYNNVKTLFCYINYIKK